MMPAILLIAAWLLALSGAALLALANQVHWVVVTGGPVFPIIGRRSRLLGSALLILSVSLAILRDGPGMGILLGALLIACGLAMVIAALAVRPTLLRMFALVAPGGTGHR